MKNKKISFMDHLEYYFNIYLPTVKGLSQSTDLNRRLVSLQHMVSAVCADGHIGSQGSGLRTGSSILPCSGGSGLHHCA